MVEELIDRGLLYLILIIVSEHEIQYVLNSCWDIYNLILDYVPGKCQLAVGKGPFYHLPLV